MKTALASICLFTVAAACWLGVMEVVLHHPGFAQRIVVAGLIASQSLLTLFVVGRSAGRAGRVAASAGALGILALGFMAVVRNVTGSHFEGFAVVIGAALVLQAVLTWWTVPGSPRWT